MKRTTSYDNEDQYNLAHGAIVAARMRASEYLNAATDPDDREHYLRLVKAYDTLIAKFR